MTEEQKLQLEEDRKKEYEVVLVPDKVRLADYLARAKGEGRTMAEFAEVCDIPPATFSRIMNRRIIRPLKVDLIYRILQNAADDSHIGYELFMRANGMLPKNRGDEVRNEGLEERRNAIRNEEAVVRNVISDELFARNRMIQFYPGMHAALYGQEHLKSTCGLGLPCSFALKVGGDEALFWNFILSDHFWEEDPEHEETAGRYFLRRFMRIYGRVFLQDVWEPETINDIHNSFVFTKRKPYEVVKSVLGRQTVNTRISLILIDPEEQHVAEEFLIPGKDGKERKSIFDEEPGRFYEEDPEDGEYEFSGEEL